MYSVEFKQLTFAMYNPVGKEFISIKISLELLSKELISLPLAV